jgi:outer membrane protein OmpA-like peptidoglycan-associated protein
MYSHVLKNASRIFALAAAALAPAALSAQAAPPASGTASTAAPYASKWDIFAGYSYLAPHGTVQVPQPNGSTVPFSYDAVNVGGLFSGARYFNRIVGAQIEFGEHEWGSQSSSGNVGTHGNDDGLLTFGGGLIARFPTGDVTPFIHGLVNAAQISGPDHNKATWGPGLTVGGGMDYETPLFNHHLAIRVFQADYQYMHADFGPQAVPPGGRANINAARLSAGVVFHVGSIAPPPAVTLACTASPSSVFPGEPITITASADNLNPKESTVYSWTGNGVSGNGSTATVKTDDLAPGSYSAQGTVKTGKKGKEGLKPWQTATCSASFTVKEFEPPTISCSANPATIQPGGTATITSQAVSPQNRPLTYSYTATAGTVTGSGNTAEFSSAGAPTGAVGVTCNVSDDKGHTASAQTTVTIEAPPPPPQPHAQALCNLSFSKDKARPTRVDNEAKACLDQIALNLKQQADAKAVLVGNADSKEKSIEEREQKRAAHNRHVKVENFAAQRAVNAKDYLVTEQGIDASRISVATGTADEQSVQDYLVPAGANFDQDVQGTTPVDESTLKPQARKPLPQRHHHHAHSQNSQQ